MRKQGFMLYKSFYAAIKNLSLEDKGKLFDAIFKWQISEGNYVCEYREVCQALDFFIAQFETDNAKYDEICEKRRNAVEERWQREK